MERILAFASNTRTLVSGLLRIGDVLVVFMAGLSAYWFHHDHIDLPDNYLVALVLGILLTIIYHHMGGLYKFTNLRSLAHQFGPLTMSWVAVILTLIAIGYFTKTSDIFSRIWMVYWMGLNLSGFLLLRLWAAIQLETWYKAGKLRTNLAIVGSGNISANLARLMGAQKETIYNLVGVFDEGATCAADDSGKKAADGSVEDLLDQVRRNAVDEIVVALPWDDETRLAEVLTKLSAAPVAVHLCPEVLGFPYPVRGYSTLAGVPMLDVFEPPLSGWNLVVKAVEDYVLATALLVLFLPVMAVIAIAIGLENQGPVLFRQRRYGFNNNEFTVYKFRTMRTEFHDDSRVPQARRNDPRITRIGAFLRHTSLDELPQLFNVIRGEMSIVGPRPHAVAHNKHFARIIDGYLNRHKVKPGITGWAQINGLRGETDTPDKMQMRVQHDLHYIDHWSLAFDLRIIFLTPFVAFVHPNAY